MHDSNLFDPKLSEHGVQQALSFQNNLVTASISYLLASPMFRTLETSDLAFRYFVVQGDDIITWLESQNMDIGPNGTGKNTYDLQREFSGRYIETRKKVDVWTFMSNDWSEKTRGKWSPGEVSGDLVSSKDF